MNQLLENPETKNREFLKQFLEMSSSSTNENFKKFKETYIRKRSGGRYKERGLILKCCSICKCWNKRFMTITSEGIQYSLGFK